jgi:predicted ATPase
MITKLKVGNFKSHKNTQLDLGNLTLLTGLNSSGKSSIIQAFLLLRQSYQKGRLAKGLDLNEPLVDVGKGTDALYRYANENEIISFDITAGQHRYHFSFDASDKLDATFLPITSDSTPIDATTQLPFFTHHFQYLGANRMAAAEFYPTDSFAVEEEKQVSRNYGQGELVAHFLEYFGERYLQVHDSLLHPDEPSRKLIDQVVAWEREISPRLTIIPEKVADKIAIRYGYKSTGDNEPLRGLNPKNVGFGISYSLPIVVAILSAQPGALLLVENPEAHLHPKGQAKLTELICLAAENGIQLIVETHSDHVLNAVLIACKRHETQKKGIDKQKVAIYFFGERDQYHASQCTRIPVLQGGKIEQQPHGFFDQMDADLQEIMGF